MSNDFVFINCPFDDEFKQSFEALLFAIVSSGYRVRCALEESDSGAIRYDKLCRLIDACDYSVHDLSRTELSAHALPRFNMPFELGLFMGATRFGGKRHKRKTALVLVREMNQLPTYLSDLAGIDPEAHRGNSLEIIRHVRRYLHSGPEGIQLPGARVIQEEFERFKLRLPSIAAAMDISSDEIDPYREYRTYLGLLEAYLWLV